MGKTSLAMNIAQYVTVVEQLPVAVFSLEMGIDQLALRMLACEAWINQSFVRSASSLTMLKEEDWSKLLEASGKLNDSPLYIDDTPGISPVEIRAKIRRLVSQVDVRLVVVDYLQLMTLRTRTDSREQEISEISRTLKAIAKEFNIPVIAISQLNRRVEERGDKRPMMSDLRESGAIEQDADVICFIYRDDVYNPDSAEKGIAEIIIGREQPHRHHQAEVAARVHQVLGTRSHALTSLSGSVLRTSSFSWGIHGLYAGPRPGSNVASRWPPGSSGANASLSAGPSPWSPRSEPLCP